MARRKKTLVGLALVGAAGLAGYACDRKVKQVVDLLLAAVVEQIRRLQYGNVSDQPNHTPLERAAATKMHYNAP